MNYPAHVPDSVRLVFNISLSGTEVPTEHRELIERICTRPEMRECFYYLDKAFREDEGSVARFMMAALRARAEFPTLRESSKLASQLRAEIGMRARELATLLERVAPPSVRIFLPSAFFELNALLALTPYPLQNDGEMGAAERTTQPPLGAGTSKIPKQWPHVQSLLVSAQHVAPATPARPSPPVESIWLDVPELCAFISTLASVAENPPPLESEPFPEARKMIEAAIQSQKPDVRLDYLRAFVHLLQNTHKVQPGLDVRRAIAIVATVVLADVLDDGVSSEDVARVCKEMGYRKVGDFSDK